MSSRRLLKAASAVRQVVSMAILAELRDPRVQGVTVTHVEMSPDMREAKVFVSIMGDETKQNLALRGLQSACGFLQSKIAERIETRYTPRLRFVADLGVKRSLEVAEILHRVLSEDKTADDAADAADAADPPADDAATTDDTSPPAG
jgi:ribosome-binding factor A